ncbi:carbohydrate-binding domain-containing protein [Microbacterium sp. zg.Y1090]|uniref:carbohydrate-binding domain-containing protein n=1 Tax=Microbacterium TaxID=33882 RepID=UPI00214B3FEF|nr:MULTISPECIES: carbohydrate-binding domain-containing protein [unclassified Microbacterium]MCR2812433.1 carbohydrate-binding domain-containing protein [Microbacterium sp. zg.Y1084]MCR2817766.1 carbohydrate-binding domain-containing protein [Microbacterium sp. zg.Y1090]MDL5485590.1 carbohydrate-binding domain-containing protein [Microbacterium sp. zg-Y1211]WIM28761.1 carbohydrate-binding domain-containing protein [Microbacterium sp. zg-Y1090]
MTPRDDARPSRRRRWLVAAPTALALTLAGCATDASTAGTGAGAATPQPESSAPAVDATLDGFSTAADVRAGNEQPDDSADSADVALADAVTIDLAGSTATASPSGAVTIDGSTVTISAAGTYRLSGELDGQIVVAAAEDAAVTLVLDDVDVANSDGAAIDIRSAGQAAVVLAGGSSNVLSDARTYPDDADAHAALHSAADLTITGEGSLAVAGNGGDGIASAGGLVIRSGEITVDAVGDGIRGTDHLVVRDGVLDITAGDDGLTSDDEEHAERGYVDIAGGTVTVSSGDDGIDASTDVVLTGGSVDITAGGGAAGDPESGAKGVVAGTIAVLEGGTLTIDAADDAVDTDAYVHLAGTVATLASGDDGAHAELQLVVSGGEVTVPRSVEGLEAGQITITDGSIEITAGDDGINVSEPDAGTAELTLVISGGDLRVDADGDGLDANGSIVITGGSTIVQGPTSGGEGALDADAGITIEAGTLFALGSAGMAQAPSADSAQASVQFTVTGVPEGTELTVVSAEGEQLGTVISAKQVQNVVFSAPELVNGETYTLTSDGRTLSTAVAGQQRAGGMGGPGDGMVGPGGTRP